MSGDERLDPETAESLARDRIKTSLQHPATSNRSDLARLVAMCANITAALEKGDPPNQRDTEQARYYATEVLQRLDACTQLFGQNTTKNTSSKDDDANDQ